MSVSVLTATPIYDRSGRPIRQVIAGVPGLTGPPGRDGVDGQDGQGTAIGSPVPGATADTRLYVDANGDLAAAVFSDRSTLPADLVYTDSVIAAGNISGTISDANLSANVALYNGTTAFSTLQTFNAGIAPAFVRFGEIDLTASPISGAVNNYTLGGQTGGLFRIAGSGTVATITGISISQVAGRIITLYNGGTTPIILGGAGSSLSNRFDWGNSAGYYTLNQFQTVTLVYDGTPVLNARRWRPLNSMHSLSGLDIIRPYNLWADNLLSIRDETGTILLAVSFDGGVIDGNGLSRVVPAYTSADIGKVLAIQDDGGGGPELAWSYSYIPVEMLP